MDFQSKKVQAINQVAGYADVAEARRIETARIRQAAEAEARAVASSTPGKRYDDALEESLFRRHTLVNKLRVGVRSVLQSGLELDPAVLERPAVNVLAGLQAYDRATTFGESNTEKVVQTNRANDKVMLRNAAEHPETFESLGPNLTQRESLATRLHNLGVFGPEGADVILTILDPHTEDHISTPSPVDLNPSFIINWQHADIALTTA